MRKNAMLLALSLGFAALACPSVADATYPAPRVDPCVDVPGIGDLGMNGYVPTLTTQDEVATVYIVYDREGGIECPDVTATVQKSDGTHRQVVPFDGHGGVGSPPEYTILAGIPIPVADGAGDWVVTRVTRGTVHLDVSVKFRIERGTVTTIDQPGPVNGPAKTTVTGLVRRYTATGTLAAAPAGTPVRLMHQNETSLIASATTATNGRYRVTVPFTVNTTMRAVSPDIAPYASSQSDLVTAHVRAVLARIAVPTTGFVNRLLRVDGQAFPRTMSTRLEYWYNNSWYFTVSSGVSATDGTFTRWWKPTTPGTFRLRVTISKSSVDGSPIVREKTVTITSRQTVPTYLDGVVGATSEPVTHQGAKMSTFGHLRVRRTNGTVGPFANQTVLIQFRPLSEPEVGWYTAARPMTTSTGYFYTNWNVVYAGDAEVRIVYTSPYETIKNAQLGLGVIHVQ